MAVPKGSLAQGLLTAAQDVANTKQDDAALEAERIAREEKLKAEVAALDAKPAKGVKFRTSLRALGFPLKDGTKLQFVAGQLVVEDPDHIAQLRAGAGIRGSVYWEVK